MACINMHNSEGLGSGAPPPMSPRISFSSDFAAEVPHAPRRAGERLPTDPNFEFAVGGRPMMTADELFFKGRLIPLITHGKTPSQPPRVITLKEELMADDEWNTAASARPPALRGRWKELLGLRKPTVAARKHDSRGEGIGSEGSISDRATMLLDDPDTSATQNFRLTQDLGSREGGPKLKEPELELC